MSRFFWTTADFKGFMAAAKMCVRRAGPGLVFTDARQPFDARKKQTA